MITWISGVTGGYVEDLSRLVRSTGILTGDHRFVLLRLPPTTAWRHTIKFDLLREILPTVRHGRLFWIDADCEFAADVPEADLARPDRPLTCVRHFAIESLGQALPDRLRSRRRGHDPDGSYNQACLFGGELDAMGDLLRGVDWMAEVGETYDEYGLNLYWDEHRDRVHQLCPAYAAPGDFRGFPGHRSSFEERRTKPVQIVHHNRNLNPLSPR